MRLANPFAAGDKIAVFHGGYVFEIRVREVHQDEEAMAAILLWRADDILEVQPEVHNRRPWSGVHILLDDHFHEGDDWLGLQSVDWRIDGLRGRYPGWDFRPETVWHKTIEYHTVGYPVSHEFGYDREATLNTLIIHARAEREEVRRFRVGAAGE